MLKKKFVSKLKKEYSQSVSERRQIISQSNIVLHNSKRVIFSLHRGEIEKADKDLQEITDGLARLQKNFGYERLNEEGSYKAAIEEYAEARIFRDLSQGVKADAFPDLRLSHESYMGGICDATGELVRHATNQAARGERQEVARIKEMINDIMADLVEFDMTGYLRTKYDQARGNLRKIEQMAYDISLRD